MSDYCVVNAWGRAPKVMKFYLVRAEGTDPYEWAEDERQTYDLDTATRLAAEFGGRVEVAL